MNDLERELRSVLEREAGDAPSPHETRAALRRTRRRQLRTVAATSLGVAAAVIVVVAGFRSLGGEQERLVPASTTQTMNGITITFPETWHLIDPDRAGLNGPTGSEPTEDLPRLIMALSPTDPGDAFGCPGLGQTPGPPPTFLMTIQEMPRALAGDSARPWPVELEPLEVDASESGCYPGWAFSQTAWSAAGRTFVAAVGIAPEASDAERQALFAAFASMTFEPAADGATSVVLATGTAGGEQWSLTASSDGSGLELGLQSESFGAGIGGFEPSPDNLLVSSHVLGQGEDREIIVFGAVPLDVVRVEAFPGLGGAAVSTEVLDVPDEIGARMNAFILILDYDLGVELEGVQLNAYDAEDRVVLYGTVGREGEPVETPLPAEGELEDGRHFGFVRSVDISGRTIAFDLAYWLSGEEANQAYQEAGGTGPVPNDYFVVNDNPKLRTLPLSPDLRLLLVDWMRCCDETFEGDLGVFATAIERGEDVRVGDLIYRGNSSWWVTVEGGVVVKIEEQYTP